MLVTGSQRIKSLGSAIFSEVATWKEEAKRQGLNLIDLGIGSPDQPPSNYVIETLKNAVANPLNYGYPATEGTLPFRQTVARWYEHRFGVRLDPLTEVLTLMGSQDGLAHLALAVTDPGDVAIVPDPGYPIYSASLVLAGVQSYPIPLKRVNDFLPNLSEIPAEIASHAKMMILNYPSNPLAAVADHAFFEQVVEFAHRHNILIAHDLAYSEMTFDGFQATSILQVDGAKEVAVEFHSLSKSFNMAGCRIAFMVGQPDVVASLKMLKSNIDYGVFHAIQEAGIAALEEDMRSEQTVAELYERRRNIVVDGLRQVGWDVPKPKATMFIWAPIPEGWTSSEFSREILRRTGVSIIPGEAFGSEGEGYVRIALVQEEALLQEAVDRIGRVFRSL